MKRHHLARLSQSLLTGLMLCLLSGPAFAQPAPAPDDGGKKEDAAAKEAPAPNDAASKEMTAPARHNSIAELIVKTNPALAAVQKTGKGAVSADARQYVDAIQNYYDSARTYSATFEQGYETVDGVKKTSSGVVWFKKPGMMRWDYEKPESRFLISDGKYLWSWEPVYRQYCKQDLGKSQLPSALSFLTGKGRIDDEFSVTLKKVDGNRVSLDLKPVAPSLAYESIRFEILMPSAKVYRATIYDAMGNMNRITFKSPEINAALEDSSFRFEPPADARHICE